MDWDDAEAAIRAHIETQWALGSYTAIPLVFENEDAPQSGSYMAVNIEGTFADKSIYGSSGKRASVEGGIVFFHAFVPPGTGKGQATGPVVALTQILELQTIGTGINLEGGNPPSPIDHGDSLEPNQQPGGMYYRCSGSVPFIVIGNR